MAALPIILMAASTAVQVASTRQQGKMAEAQAKADAATLEANAMSKKAAAAEKSRYYGIQAKRAAEEGRSRQSSTIASLAAGGVSASTGTSAVLLAKAAQDTADEIYEFQRAGSMAYRTGMWEADWDRQMARYTRRGGKYAKRGYQLQATGKGLSGAYDIYKEWPGKKTTLTS